MRVLQFVKKLVLVLALCSSLAAADSIQLRNGRHLQGKYIGGTTSVVGFMTSGAVEYFPTADVLALMFDNSDGALNGLQPNHMNGDGWQTEPGTVQKMSVRPQRSSRQSQLELRRVDAVWCSLAD